MTFEDAIALQPAWVGVWLNVLFFGAFILPLTLLIWRQTRLLAVVTVAASVLAGFGVYWLFGQLGYVKLLGLPHIVIWTPIVIYLLTVWRRPDVALWPKRIILVVTTIILISLAFDYVDVAKYFLGDRDVFAGN